MSARGQGPTKAPAVLIGSSTPSRRHSDGMPIAFIQTTGAANFLNPETGNRRFFVVSEDSGAELNWTDARPQLKQFITGEAAPLQAWHDTQDDPEAPVVQARQELEPLAGVVVGGVSLMGVAILLGWLLWLWWAGHGGKWVSPW